MEITVTADEALEQVKAALNTVRPGASENINLDSDLAQLETLDSLHLMELLFELENQNGRKIEAFSEEFTDFRVPTLVDILKNL